MSYFSEEEINEIRERLGVGDGTKPETQKGCFDWEAAKNNLIETECGINLCREDYFEGDKKHFTFDEALEIEKEAKKHGFRLPTVVDFEKLYAFYGLGEDGEDKPQKLVDELGFTYAGFYNGATLYYVGTYGLYWSSSIYNTYSSYNLSFDTSNVGPQNLNSKLSGLAVKFVYDEKLLEGEENG